MTTNLEELQPIPVNIARADIADSPMIANVFIRSRAGMEYIDPNLHSEEETRDWITSLLSDEENIVLKAMSDNKIDGFCVLHEGWLDHMYVTPDSQSRGIGSSLLRQAQSMHAELQLWVFQQNSRAIQLYKKNGFNIVEETDGSRNEEHLPDARYIWRRQA